MNDQSVEAKLTPAEVLRLWADKIERNAAEDFAGVFVVIPPTGDAIASLFIDPEQNVGNFFAMVKTKIEAAVDVINEAQRRQPGFR